MDISIKIGIAFGFFIYLFLMGLYFIVYKSLIPTLKNRKDRTRAKEMAHKIEERYPSHKAERDKKIREARERSIIKSGIRMSLIGKYLTEVKPNVKETEIFTEEKPRTKRRRKYFP